MKTSDRYMKIVEWSVEDGKCVGTCPELFGGGCHGADEVAVYGELCMIVDEVIRMKTEDGDPLPEPKLHEAFKESRACVLREQAEVYDVGAQKRKSAKGKSF